MPHAALVYNVEFGELRTRLRDAGHTELEALVGTIAETLIAQGEARGLLKGRAEGMAEGKAEGEAEGRAQGKAEMLIRLLEHRFGPMPGDIRNRIAASGVGQVEAWLDAAVDVLTWRQISHPDGRTEFVPPAALNAIMETRAPD